MGVGAGERGNSVAKVMPEGALSTGTGGGAGAGDDARDVAAGEAARRRRLDAGPAAFFSLDASIFCCSFESFLPGAGDVRVPVLGEAGREADDVAMGVGRVLGRGRKGVRGALLVPLTCVPSSSVSLAAMPTMAMRLAYAYVPARFFACTSSRSRSCIRKSTAASASK